MLTIIIAVIIFLLFFLYGYLSNLHFVTKTYDIVTNGRTGDHRFVVIADLHDCHYGKGNRKLLDRIDEISPDVVLIPGDLTVKHDTLDKKRVKDMLDLLHELSKKYTVYYSPGNHEIRMYDYDEYKAELDHIGIKYAENRELFFPDPKIRIYGLDLPIEWYRENRSLSVDQLGTFLNRPRAEQVESYTILLAHDPRHFDTYSTWGADLIVSGHLHGGIMKLPILGGVISPSLGLFPKYDGGLFEKDGKRMVVSRGMGSHTLKFRFFNPPELVVINLKKNR